MLVSLMETLHPLRAHIQAGLLQQHGIPAWVWGDVTSCSYGSVTTGGCRVMVDEENLAAANEVLDSAPEPVEEPPPAGALESEKTIRPLGMPQALGAGIVSGAVLLPLVLILFTLLGAVLSLVMSGISRELGFPAALSRELLANPFRSVVPGAVWGALGGLAAWFISDYKRQGLAGRLFAGLMIAFMAVIALLL